MGSRVRLLTPMVEVMLVVPVMSSVDDAPDAAAAVVAPRAEVGGVENAGAASVYSGR